MVFHRYQNLHKLYLIQTDALFVREIFKVFALLLDLDVHCVLDFRKMRDLYFVTRITVQFSPRRHHLGFSTLHQDEYSKITNYVKLTNPFEKLNAVQISNYAFN